MGDAKKSSVIKINANGTKQRFYVYAWMLASKERN